MSYTSSVPRIANDQFITIRASYVRICNGNAVAAALISYFETWHNYKLKALREWNLNQFAGPKPSTWQHHTIKELEKGIIGIGKRHSIDQAKEQLAQMGIIVIGRNPDPKFAFDATLHYQFQPDAVAAMLAFVENSKSGPDVEIDISEYAENDSSECAEIRSAIPNDSRNITTNETISHGDPQIFGKGEKNKTRRRPGEPDRDWQRWVDRWHDHVMFRLGGVAPMINPVQLAALKRLRIYLCQVATQQEGRTAEDSGYAAWDFILTNWDKLDDWLRAQFDLTVVLKKITDILNQLKNGNGNHKNGGTSQQRADALRNY